jgi:hypothetical protein
MDLRPGDIVVHESIGQTMTIVGLDDFNGRQLAWCEWIDPAGGDTKGNTFPESELVKQVRR